ncbi:MAG: hypothetical protein ACLS8D_09315 [Clostridioides difficile]
MKSLSKKMQKTKSFEKRKRLLNVNDGLFSYKKTTDYGFSERCIREKLVGCYLQKGCYLKDISNKIENKRVYSHKTYFKKPLKWD